MIFFLRRRTTAYHRLLRIPTHISPVPKGHVPVYVSLVDDDDDDVERFLVPVSFLGHRLFTELLAQAEQEFGFDPPPIHAYGCLSTSSRSPPPPPPSPDRTPVHGLRLSCSASHFRHTLSLIHSSLHRNHNSLCRLNRIRSRIARCIFCSKSSASNSNSVGRRKERRRRRIKIES